MIGVIQSLKLLFLGDVVGKAGRDALALHLPVLQQKLAPDVIVVNAENAAGGFGLTRAIANEFFALGVDVITTGNHVWKQKEIKDWIAEEPRVLRPLNFPEDAAGRGFVVIKARTTGQSVLVMNPMGRVFMMEVDCPFVAVDRVLETHKLGQDVAAILVDIHAEATSEKQALGHYLDGRVSLVVGTHTHTPTADAHILPLGTAYQSDAGMCGDYAGVIGFNPAVPIARFCGQPSPERLTPALGEGTVCGVLAELGTATGLALSVRPIRIGGCLAQSL